MCNNVNHGKFEAGVGFPTARRFGVELEGYVDTHIYGDHCVENKEWYVDSDGSLNGESEQCGRCDGDGAINCPSCHGSGNESCNSCNGDGEVDCSYCYGSGCTEDETDCSHCNGSGDVRCGNCDGKGSITCDHCDGNCDITCPSCDGDSNESYGIEAKSPPLKDTSPIYDMYNWLSNYGWHVDDSAGLHIHVEANDYKDEDFRKLLALMIGVEPFVYSITNSYRYHGSSYCYPITRCRTTALNLLRHGRGEYDSHRIFADTRYMGLNFEAYENYNTIEFRYFAPQDDAEPVVKYVELVTKIVDFAKNASMEQILVIVEKLIQSQRSFDELSEVIKEVFQLSYEPIGLNSVFIQYSWFTESDIQSIRQSNNISVAEAV